MQRIYLYFGSFLLGFALLAPAGLQAEDRDHNCPDNGYYDRDHKDCHTWNDLEDRAYRHWEEAEHKTHREFSKLKDKEQSEYWRYRHEHPDNDRDHRDHNDRDQH
jgi:hypothetical protein